MSVQAALLILIGALPELARALALAPHHLGDEEGHLQALGAVEAGVAAGLACRFLGSAHRPGIGGVGLLLLSNWRRHSLDSICTIKIMQSVHSVGSSRSVAHEIDRCCTHLATWGFALSG